MRIKRYCGVLALLACSLSACSRTPTESAPPPLGEATLTVETPTGQTVFSRGEAAFYIYNPGPTPSDRAMYLVLGSEQSIEIEFYQWLEPNAGGPVAGEYRTQYGALGGDPTMGGGVLIRRDTTVSQLFPIADSSTVTLEEVTTERITGRLSMVLKADRPGAQPEMKIYGTFRAARVAQFEDLPRHISNSLQ